MSVQIDYVCRCIARLRPWMVCVVAALSSYPLGAQTPPLMVAAASDLQTALPPIVTAFENSTGQRVSLAFGSSGNFFTQIRNGAPFDVFLSADIDYPRQLEQSGLAVTGSLYPYATGRIVLWARKDAGVDLTKGLSAVVTSAAVRRIAIANPLHAPYGRAAVAALRQARVYERVQSKLVMGESISQAAQFAQSGNAQVGILALSLALSAAMKNAGGYASIPEAVYPPIQQAAVIVAKSNRQTIAREFIEALKGREAQELFRSSGFGPPAGSR